MTRVEAASGVTVPTAHGRCVENSGMSAPHWHVRRLCNLKLSSEPGGNRERAGPEVPTLRKYRGGKANFREADKAARRAQTTHSSASCAAVPRIVVHLTDLRTADGQRRILRFTVTGGHVPHGASAEWLASPWHTKQLRPVVASSVSGTGHLQVSNACCCSQATQRAQCCVRTGIGRVAACAPVQIT